MATSDPRKNLLTAKLDFEAVDGGPIKTSAISDESLDEWGFNLDPAKIESKENDKVDKTVASVPVSPALQAPPMIPLSQKAARVGANQKNHHRQIRPEEKRSRSEKRQLRPICRQCHFAGVYRYYGGDLYLRQSGADQRYRNQLCRIA